MMTRQLVWWNTFSLALCVIITPVYAAPLNCYEMRSANRALADGAYTITVNGRDVQVYCDMANGGWTRVLNVLSTSPGNTYLTTSAINEGTTTVSTLYKFADADINTMAGSNTRFKFKCWNRDSYVGRASGWTSTVGASDWQIDRNLDFTYDCTASRTNFIFSDYLTFANPWYSGADCAASGHIALGENSGNVGCWDSYVNSWG
jgi:hypothetical protein